jgi:small subunit ribosomal protein S8
MDVIADFLAVIRNGIMASKSFVVVPHSNMRAAVAAILKGEGFVSDVLTVRSNEKLQLKVVLKYVAGESVIHEIKRISKPSRRIYKSINMVKPVIGGLGVSILSTNKGIISHKKAKELNVGGEVLCTIW